MSLEELLPTLAAENALSKSGPNPGPVFRENSSLLLLFIYCHYYWQVVTHLGMEQGCKCGSLESAQEKERVICYKRF
jgi:hypothetical protein